MKEEKMPLIMKHIVWLNFAWQWRYLTDKKGFLFIGTHCIVAIVAMRLRNEKVYSFSYCGDVSFIYYLLFTVLFTPSSNLLSREPRGGRTSHSFPLAIHSFPSGGNRNLSRFQTNIRLTHSEFCQTRSLHSRPLSICQVESVWLATTFSFKLQWVVIL